MENKIICHREKRESGGGGGGEEGVERGTTQKSSYQVESLVFQVCQTLSHSVSVSL